MINKYLPLFLVLSSALIVKAQPVVNADILFSPGDQATVNYVETVFSPGPAGADVEWNFSGLNSNYSINWMAVTPESTAFQDSFPTATIAFFIPANDAPQILEDTYAFYRQDGNDFSYLGSTLSGDINGNIDTSFFTLNLDADHLYTFPLAFGDNNEDEVEGVNTVNIQGNSLVTFRMGTTTTEVDGYGTLHTPAGTFENVLRVKRTEDLADDLSGIATTQEIVRYDWVSPNHRYLLFHTEEIIIRDFLGNEQSRSTVTYYSTPEVINSTEQGNIARHDFRAYPNPTSDFLQLDVPSDLFTQAADLWIYTAQGQRVYQQLRVNLNERINVSQLPAGYYWIDIRQGENRFQTSFTKS